jgi:hypothetical protein
MAILNPPPGAPTPKKEEPMEKTDKVVLRDSDILSLLSQKFSESRSFQGIIEGLIENKTLPSDRSEEFFRDIQLILEHMTKTGIIKEIVWGNNKRFVLRG